MEPSGPAAPQGCAHAQVSPWPQNLVLFRAAVAHPVLLLLWVGLDLFCSCLVGGGAAPSGSSTAAADFWWN